MKAKYFVIFILVLLLGLTVKRMLSIEEQIRSEKIKYVQVFDKNKPLFNPLPLSELFEAAENSEFCFLSEGDYFKVLNPKNEWEKVFFKGVNIGTAVPGKFPTEFSLTFNEYLEWFRLIGEMNANVIRVYTILPPEFYKALAVHNQKHFSQRLYLFQGVWTELPPNSNFYDKDFIRNFQEEILKVVDLIHGNAVIPSKPGHASGVYATDISKYVAGILLGREWEPDAVEKTNRKYRINSFNGSFISVHGGNAMEVWLAEMMDFTIHYETQTYLKQRPVTFVNWLPLDPMYHHSEYIEAEYVREYDNDLKSLDFTHFHHSPYYKPGIFASYHVYPYYPDFIYNEKKYNDTVKTNGQKDNFYFYLLDLKEHCKGMPLLISEYGLPSSRGNSHYTPTGLDQGGHSEQEQANLSMVLTKDIFETKCAGAIYFEWIDEWFKYNWLVMDFEQPAENRRQWHNLENPEQNYGILAYESRKKSIDAKTNDWPDFNSENDYSVNFSADPAYFYLLSHLPDFDFRKNNLYIAFDTYDKLKGEHKIKFLKQETEYGIEFLAEFKNLNTAELFVDDYYSVYTDRGEQIVPDYCSKNNNNGVFVSQLMLANRKRESVSGDTYPELRHNRGTLIYGKSTNPSTSNADWYWSADNHLLEARFTWQILNVSDPSTCAVLDNKQDTRDIDCSVTDGFNIILFITDKNDKLIKTLPENKAYHFKWEAWLNPEYQKRTKPIYYALKTEFGRLNIAPTYDEETYFEDKFSVLPYPDGYKGAVSLVFNLNESNIRQVVLPALETYQAHAAYIFSESNQSNSKNYAFSINKNLAASIDSAGHDLIYSISEYLLQKDFEELKAKILASHDALGIGCNSILTHTEISADIIKRLKNESNIELVINMKQAYFNNNKFSILNFQNIDNYQQADIQLNTNQTWYYLYIDKIVNTSAIKKDATSVTTEQLHRLIRLIRNNEYWIASPAKVLQYQSIVKNCSVKSNKYKNLIFMTCEVPSDIEFGKMPVTIAFQSDVKTIKVSNSADDGIYNLYEGKVLLKCFPNKEITIEILEP